MKKKLPIAIRGILSTAFLLLVASLLNTTPVQSAFPQAPNADPTFTLTKTVINDNGGSATQANFQAKIDDGFVVTDVVWDTANQYSPGTYTASELALVPGYSASVWGTDCAEDGSITLEADQEATCSITNDDLPPSLILTKTVNINYGGDAVAADWTLTATGPTSISGPGGASSGPSFDAGVYTLSESTGPAGYTSGSWICTGGSQVGDQITIALGDVVSCSISSDDIQPQLTVIKNVISDNGGTLGPGNFTINVTGTNVSDPSFPGAISPGTTITLNAGSYGVSETPITGYESTPSADCSGTIAVGETKTCTILNEDFARLTVVKDPTNDNGGSALEDDFLLTVDGSPVDSGVATEYPIDTLLPINETLLIGYAFVEITDDGSEKCPDVLGGTVTLALGDDITCTIVNDDVPAINPVPAGDLVTDENGTTDEFTVVLTTEFLNPLDTVTILVSSSLETEATVDPVVLTFTSVDWNIPQPVTVTGVEDQVADGDIPYNIILDPSTSAATEYAGLTAVLVSGTNFDNDTAGYIITPTDNLLTTEGGVAQNIAISLRSRPISPVTLSIVSSDPFEGTVSPASIIIDPTIWPQPAKVITITGVDDCLDDGDVDYDITITATSTDPKYTGQVDVLIVTNHDAPTIRWVSPVENDGIYYAEGLGPILLEVESMCPEPIRKVRFYRWVPSLGDWVTIGEDLTPPYQETIDPSELNFGWNEIRAFAFGPPPTLPGEIQTYSTHPLIFIYKGYGDERVFLPIVNK